MRPSNLAGRLNALCMFNLLESAEERLLSPAALPGDPDSQSKPGTHAREQRRAKHRHSD